MAKQKFILGAILLVILTSSVYLVLNDEVRIDIQKTRSIFQVYEDGSWVVSGIEYVNLFDGTAKMRASERNIVYDIFENTTIITRTAQYKQNILVVERYVFDGNNEDVRLFPVEHSIEVIGADRPERPFILQYEVQKLLYTGETIGPVSSPQSFGHKMEVEWDDGNYYSRIYKYSGKDEGKLTIKYRIDSDRFSKNVRLFDPPENITVTLNSPVDNFVTIENVTFNCSANTTINSLSNMSLYTNESGVWGSKNVTEFEIHVEGLVSYWKLDEQDLTGSGTIIDSLNLNNGTNSGANNITGIINTAYDFESSESDYINIPNSVSLETASNKISVNAWIKKESTSLTGVIVSRWTANSPASNRPFIFLFINDLLRIAFNDNDFALDAAGTITDTDWHMVTFTYDKDLGSNQVKLYIDGAFSSQGTYTTAVDMTGDVDLSIGAERTGGTPITFFDGEIDEIFYGNESLTSDEVDELWNDGAAARPLGAVSSTQTWENVINDSIIWNCQACETDGACAFAEANRTIHFDNESPVIVIIFPEPIDYFTSVESFNYTASDFSGDKCWYSADFGVTNSSTEDFGVNFTGVPLVNGTNNWTVYCNDSLGLENSETVSFNITEITNVSIDLNFSNIIAELGGDIVVNASNTIGVVCVDVDHPDYGVNSSCDNFETTFDLIIDYFRKVIFNDSTITQTLEFVGTQIIDIFFPAHQYDEVDNMSINITGINTAQYPENVQINKSNTTEVDRIFPGFLTGNLIYLNKLNTGIPNSTLFFSSLAPQSIEFFMDDGATFNNFTFNITGLEFGFDYDDEFNDSSVLDSVLNEGLFRGGFALPKGTDLFSFIYDAFTPNGAIDSLLWTVNPDGSFGGIGSADYEWTVANRYSSSEMILSLNMNEDVNVGFSAERDLDNFAYSNFSLLNIWTTQELNFKLSHFNSAVRRDSVNTCDINPQAHIGTVKLWEAPWQVCESRLSPGLTCTVGSETLEDLVFNLSRNVNNSWTVEISGVERTFGTALEDMACGAYSFVYNYTNGSITKTVVDNGGCSIAGVTVTSLENTTMVSGLEWNTVQQFKFNVNVHGLFVQEPTFGSQGCDNMVSSMNVVFINQSLYNLTNSSIVSNSVFTSSGDITDATLGVVSCVTCTDQEAGNNALPFLSADNGDNFESVTPNVEHSFTFPGTDMKYRYDFILPTEGYITNSPFLRSMNITTPKGFPTNITFDFGADGITDATFDGELNTSNSPSTITISSADISSAFTGFTTFDHLFEIPLKISSAAVGELLLDEFNLTYNPNPVFLNSTSILAYLVNSINFVDFLISVESTSGNITIDDVRYDYAGGNDTINVLAHNVDYTQNVSRNATYYYSRWDYFWGPTGVEWIYFAPTKPTNVNVTPYGQTANVPILNITNFGYGGKNASLSIYQNGTSSCVNTTMSLDNNKTNGVLLNESFITLGELSYLENATIFIWADYDCSFDTWNLFEPQYYFRQCVEGGACSTDLV